MDFQGKWYFGHVLALEILEDTNNDSEDDIPLSKVFKKNEWDEDDDIPLCKLVEKRVITPQQEISDPRNDRSDASQSSSFRIQSPVYDSDADPPYGVCELAGCKGEVFSSCHLCLILLCWKHFMEDTNNCFKH